MSATAAVQSPECSHQPNAGTEELFDKLGACHQLGDIDRSTLDRHIAARRIGYYKIGKRVFFGRRHISEFLSRNERPAKPARRQRQAPEGSESADA